MVKTACSVLRDSIIPKPFLFVKAFSDIFSIFFIFFLNFQALFSIELCRRFFSCSFLPFYYIYNIAYKRGVRGKSVFSPRSTVFFTADRKPPSVPSSQKPSLDLLISNLQPFNAVSSITTVATIPAVSAIFIFYLPCFSIFIFITVCFSNFLSPSIDKPFFICYNKNRFHIT